MPRPIIFDFDGVIVEPHDCIVIEDSVLGVQGAVAAGNDGDRPNTGLALQP